MRTFNKLLVCAMALVVPLCMRAQTEIEPNNGSGTATVLTYNTAMTGGMGVCTPTDNSTDYFKIVNLPQGQMRVQSTMSNTGPLDLEVTVFVRQSTTSVIGTYTLTAGANGTPVNDSFAFPCQGGTGTYYFSLVNPSTTYCTNYTFTVDAIAPLFANDPEPNNGGGSSVATAVNTWREGQTNFYYGDNADYFRLDLPTNGVLNIEWEAEHAGPAASTATVILRNTTTAAIQTWTLPVGANGIPATSLATLTCRSNTNYYLLSIASNICGTSYRFRYNVTAPVFANDPESNNGSGTAVTIPIDVPQDGQLNFLTYNENSDYYRLYLPNDGVLGLNVAAEHVGSDAGGTLSLSLRRSNTSAVIETWTVPVGANATPVSTLIERPCTGSTSFYYLSITSSICGASYRFSYSLTPPVFENDTEPNDSQFITPLVNLNDSSVTGHMQFYYDSGADGYVFSHFGGPLTWDMSAEHAGATPGILYASFRNSSYHNVLWGDTIVVGANGVPIRSVQTTLTSIPAQGIRVYFSTPTCGVSYRWNCADVDGDGVCDGADLCSNTPTGEGVNAEGCSCSQVIVSDGDACTLDACLNGTVTHTFQDADSDGTCDVNDGCPNDANKTAPGACGCGVADTDSDNDGLADCNDNCTNYPGQIGSICDDGDANTSGDVVTVACTCVGSAIPCPDDGNSCTLEIVVSGVCTHQPLPDADADGTCDLNDGCPNDANKVVAGVCGCGVADTDSDSDGTADCNDGCPSDPSKIAPGSCGCGVADMDGDGDATADCNDGCPGDPNKVAPGACGCGVADTDGDNDGIANCNDNCPNLAGQQGSPCDDGDANTTNDVISANCLCAGMPIAGNCTLNELTMTIQGDGSSEVDWAIYEQGTNNLVEAGGQVYPNGTFSQSLCIADGCYYLVVTDGEGDGITGGGYLLRLLNGSRIIDNSGNFTSGGTSAIANNGGFCLPLGNDRLISASCDLVDLRRGSTATCSDRLTADNTPNGTSGNVYQFWFYDPNGTLSLLYPSATGATSNQVSMNQLPSLVEGRLYNVRVRTRISAGVWRQWGPACRMMIDNAAGQCPRTSLQDEAGNAHLSCGQTKPTGNSAASLIYAKPKSRFTPSCGTQNANKYQFRFRLPSEGVVIVKYGVGSNPWTYLNMANLVATPVPSNAVLEACRTYEVEVRASFDGGATWCAGGNPYSDLAPWGKVCELYTAGCSSAIAIESSGDASAHKANAVDLHLYPNPNRGDQLMLSLSAVEEGVNTVSVDIYDTFGKRVSARTIAVSDGFINSVLELNGELAAGMYMVNITAGETQYMERLVIQP